MSKTKDILLDALDWLISHLEMLYDELVESFSAVLMGITAVLLIGFVASSPILILYIIFILFFQK